MVGTFALAGSALCAGYGIYQYRTYHPSRATPGRVTAGATSFMDSSSGNQSFAMSLRNFWTKFSPMEYTPTGYDHHQDLRHSNQNGHLWASAALAGTAAVGGAGLIPLKYIAIPVLAYNGVPAMQSSIDVLLNDRKATQGILETTALAIVLIKGAWIVGTVGFAVYHLGRWVVTATDDVGATSSTPYLVKRQDQQMTLSAKQIKIGDWISVSASNAVPIKSKVVEGSAWICPCCHTNNDAPLTVKPGDMLEKDSIVLAGSMWLEVAL